MKELILNDVDLTELMGVYKYEPPVPEDLSAKSRFPSFIQKTDEERVQNLTKKLVEWLKKPVYITEKLDGSSITIYCVKEESGWVYGVCSRNLELKLTTVNDDGLEEAVENKFVSTAKDLKLEEKMIEWCEENDQDLVLQGELIGEGIQSNKYNLHGKDIRFFTAQDGKHGRLDIIKIADELELKTVPLLIYKEIISSELDDLLAMAEEKSVLNPDQEREGIVIRAMDNSFSFKVISNKFLLEDKD